MSFAEKKIVVHFEIGVKRLVATVLLLLFFAYLVWEFYWWNKVGLRFVKWHTHLAATALIFGVISFLPAWLISKFFNDAAIRKKIFVAAVSVWAAFLFLEFICIVSGFNKTYLETRGGYYRSPFEADPHNVYHVYSAGDTLADKAPEFAYHFVHNSLGFADREWQKEKRTPLRIITLGDSFTEGDGAPQDSSYPALLQKMLGDSVEELNAGVSGSDPIFCIKNLEDRLLAYKPDVVVQAVSENDVLFDFCIRGGFERFQKDNTVKFNSPPRWETVYALSYVARIFLNSFGYDMSNPCGNCNADLIEERNQLLFQVYKRFETLAEQNNFEAVILFYPTKFETLRGKYDFSFDESIHCIDTLKHVKAISVLPDYQRVIAESKTKPQDYYWAIDGHHNSKGYYLMARCVDEKLKPMLVSK